MTKQIDYIEIKIPAKPEYVRVIRLTLSGIANRMGFSVEEIDDLKVAISEAVSNAVDHAYQEYETGEVTVGFGVFTNRLELTVADYGKSFDLEACDHRKEPYRKSSSQEEITEGGWGIFLMEALMDNVSVRNESGGVVIKMTKHLIRDEVAQGDDTTSTTEKK